MANLYINKQSVFTENKVFPYCEPADLRPELIDKARRMASFQRTNHPWKSLDDRELLNSARVYLHDYASGKEGITMAGILLFGKDETILSVLPYHRTDLILRRDDTDRYDDRDFVDTNLIESYDRIISFGQKHLPDPFYLEGTQRISIRDKVIREIASNILIHREYAKSYPAKIIIERARIVAENGNRVLSDGIIDPDNFTPNPKNPVLARFFKEIGLADELGSGVRNLFKYSPIFAGSRPVLFEDDVFRVIIPLANMKNSDEYSSTAGQVPGKYRVSKGQADRAGDVRAFCRTPKSSKEIMTHLGLSHRDYFRSEILNPLLNKGLLARTIPEKPNSPKQKYISRL